MNVWRAYVIYRVIRAHDHTTTVIRGHCQVDEPAQVDAKHGAVPSDTGQSLCGRRRERELGRGHWIP